MRTSVARPRHDQGVFDPRFDDVSNEPLSRFVRSRAPVGLEVLFEADIKKGIESIGPTPLFGEYRDGKADPS